MTQAPERIVPYHYSTPNLSETLQDARCCFIDSTGVGCGHNAVWELTYGPAPDDYTHSCPDHVAALLGNQSLENIRYIERPTPDDHLDILFDGPPGPVSGRFVEVEASYGLYLPGPVELRGSEWIEDGQFWRLRIPVRGVWGPGIIDPATMRPGAEKLDQPTGERQD